MATLKSHALEGLLATPDPPELGPGPRAGVQSETTLRQAVDELLKVEKLPADRAQLVLALILLWHDHLNISHEIVQRIATRDGAFVHGIMHRREPDYGNAQYWFNRVGRHPAFPEISEGVGALPGLRADSDLRARLIPQGKWDPAGMIAACEQAAQHENRAERSRLLREVQRVETQRLLNWMLRPDT